MTLDDNLDSESEACLKCEGEGYPDGIRCEACKGTGCRLDILEKEGHAIP